MKTPRLYFNHLLGQYIRYYTKGLGSIASVFELHPSCLAHLGNDVAVLKEGSGDRFDYILAEGNVHREQCILTFLKKSLQFCHPRTRLVITYYSQLWRWPLALATKMGWRDRNPEENWVGHGDLQNLLLLAGYEDVQTQHRVLLPIDIPVVSDLVNRYLAPLPLIRHLCLVNFVVARPKELIEKLGSVSVVVAARNEAGNLEELVERVPKMSSDDELIIIEGNSTDNTWEVMQELKTKYPEKNISIAQQSGVGKGDAVRKGFDMATRDILMILDADMTVAPEDLPMFYEAIVSGKGEYINGSRLVYPMEKKAMRFLNMIGNKFFAMSFSFVLSQAFKDTLCGTKVISKKDYDVLSKNRDYFGDFDPFGDFDLIFGASRMGLKIVEVPIRYRERTYGDTNISRWTHGLLLLRMLWFAIRKIKFI